MKLYLERGCNSITNACMYLFKKLKTKRLLKSMEETKCVSKIMQQMHNTI